MKNIIFAVALFLPAISMAAKNYGNGGCGLGSIVMGKDGNQILAATTNGTSGSQTFGITSGTSNCVDSGAVAQNQQIPMFIEINKNSLAKDAARGEGETLAGLAQLMGCNSTKLGSALKNNYDNVFIKSNMEPGAIQSNIQNLVNSNKGSACGA